MKRITNLTGGQLVSTLKDGSTLRVDYKSHVDIGDDNLTPYLSAIEKKGLVRIDDVPAAATASKTAATKSTAKSVTAKEG